MPKNACFSKKIILGILLFFCCFTAIEVVSTTANYTVFAKRAKEDVDELPDDPFENEPLKRFAYEIYDNIFGDDVGENALEALDGEAFENIGGTASMKGLFAIISDVGLALMMIYFLLELIERTTREGFSTEVLIRLLIKFLIAKALIIDCGPDILNAFLEMGNVLTESIKAAAGKGGDMATTEVMKSIYNLLNQKTGVVAALYGLVGIIPWLLSKAIDIIIQVCCYSRYIAIILYGGFAPVGCAAMVQEGFSGHGLRYLKRFIGVCLQGAVIAAIIFICRGLNAGTAEFSSSMGVGALMSACIASLIIGFVEMMCIMRVSQYTNDIMG